MYIYSYIYIYDIYIYIQHEGERQQESGEGEVMTCVLASQDCRADLLVVQLMQAIQAAVHLQNVELAFQLYQVLPIGRHKGILE